MPATPPGGAASSAAWALMGTTLELTVEARDRAAALAASERAVAALEATEARLSTWRDDTELARLNRAPVGQNGSALAVPRGGAGRGARVLAGDGRRLRSRDRRAGRRVGPAHRRKDLRVRRNGRRRGRPADGRPPHLAASRRRAPARPGAVIEEGGFGKGAGLAAALDVLSPRPGVRSAVLDLGGQLALVGAGRREVLIADPRRRDRPSWRSPSRPVSVSATSSGLRERPGHLLDPRTGEPAADFGSLTVWTADPLRADCLSTGLFVLGPERALAWAAARPERGGPGAGARRRDGCAPSPRPASPGACGRWWRGDRDLGQERLNPGRRVAAANRCPPTVP